MSFLASIMSEEFLSLLTFIWSITSIYLFMHPLVTSLTESFTTVTTFIRFITSRVRMCQFMSLLVISLTETLITVITFIMLTTYMCPFMALFVTNVDVNASHSTDIYVVYYRYVSLHVDSCYGTAWSTCHNTDIYMVSLPFMYAIFHDLIPATAMMPEALVTILTFI